MSETIRTDADDAIVAAEAADEVGARSRDARTGEGRQYVSVHGAGASEGDVLFQHAHGRRVGKRPGKSGVGHRPQVADAQDACPPARCPQLIGHIAGKAGRRAQGDEHEIGVLAKVGVHHTGIRPTEHLGEARLHLFHHRLGGQHVAVVPVLVVAIEVRAG